ncbi:restriction endonuclease subunit S [Lelliottia sp. CFBP8978]|uniref:restriction endonuclease subunit S n=1 Tax=Lelliottia sp. CFBP8978 TaxID=3096522 RepID=UPI002A69C027|nr:restriction endonuclease subunit S [Lelliottia sp. CFBP8978]MDY1037779.1 restriction endonuclease subunit S [Lelliottia sp. CFBP8978]
MIEQFNFENWSTYSLADIANYHNGYAFKPTDWAEEGTKIIRIEQLNNPDGSYDYFNGNYPSINAIKDGDLIFSWSATLKVVIWKHGPAVLNQHLFRVDEKTGFDKKFIYYVLDYNMDSISGGSHGSTMKHIRRGELSKFKIKIPELFIQNKIAHILSALDSSIEETEKLIKKYHKIRTGMMHDLFTRGVNSDGKLRPCRTQSPDLYKKTSIGWIPNEWSVIPFGNVVNVIDPNPSHRYPNESEDGYPICSTENFFGSDDFDYSKSKKVSEFVYQLQNNRCQFSSLDVIFARKGRLGLARRYGSDKKVFSHTVVIMKPLNNKVDASWLLWLARSNWFLDGISHEMNTNLGVPTLGVEFIKGINIPLCSMDEQAQINRLLDKIAEKIHAFEHELAKLERIKAGLLHDLLTGKVTVTRQEGTEVPHV